jgi:DNA-binding transcriptional MerR regulator
VPPSGFAPPEGEDAAEDGEVLGIFAEEQLQLRALRLKNRNLQKQKEILEAKRQRVSAQAKVRQMIRDEEQRAQELEQEIALMQREGQHDLEYGPPLQQRAPVGDLFIPQRGPYTLQLSKASITLMSGAPCPRNCRCHHGPPTSGQGPTPSTTAAPTQRSTS